MRAIARLLGGKGSGDTEIATRDAAQPARDETPRVVTEVALYWGDTLVRVDEHPAILVASAADFGVPDDPRWNARAALPLPEQMRESVWAHFGALSLRITRTYAARRCGRFAATDGDAAAFVGLSTLLHAAALASLAWTFAASGGSADPGILPEQVATMRAYLDAAEGAASGGARSTGATDATEVPAISGGASDDRPKNEEGHARSARAPRAAARPNPAGGAQDRDAERREPATFGMVALLDGDIARGEPGFPISAQRGDPAAERDANMWGDSIGDVFGVGGLSLSGVGEGGGGRGEGVGVGAIGTVGRAGGSSGAQGFGQGHCGGCSLSGAHTTRAPSLRCGSSVPDKPRGCSAQVNGRLPPEAVQRIVRQSYGRFRFCYEQGLAKNPALEGRVSVKFVIGRDGSVAVAEDGGSDLPDADVVSCIVRGYANLSFPQPEGGIVTVLYPLVLSPTG